MRHWMRWLAGKGLVRKNSQDRAGEVVEVPTGLVVGAIALGMLVGAVVAPEESGAAESAFAPSQTAGEVAQVDEAATAETSKHTP